MPADLTVNELGIDAGGTVLSAAAHLPASLPAPVVVCSHGLLSAKESPKFIAMCEALAHAGFCAIRFDFSGCGQSPQRSGMRLLEARKRDLAAVIAFALEQPWPDGRLGLFGSSLGGFLSFLAANERPELVGALVSWSAPFELALKHVEGPSSAISEGLRSTVNLAGLQNAGHALVVHGRLDELVPWKDSVRIYERLKEPKKLLLLRTADHRISDLSWRDAAIRESVDWFLAHLK